MKTLFKTSIIVIAAAALLTLMAGAAMAAQPDMVLEQPDLGINGTVDQLEKPAPALIDELEPLNPQPGGEGQDTPGDDGQDTPGDDEDTPGDGGQDTPGMDSGDSGQDTPGTNDGGDNEKPPASDSSGKTSTGKLPNTGTSLALLAAFAMVIAVMAYVVRRVAGKRVR